MLGGLGRAVLHVPRTTAVHWQRSSGAAANCTGYPKSQRQTNLHLMTLTCMGHSGSRSREPELRRIRDA